MVDHITPKATRYLRGITVPYTAWAQLDRRYGDRRLAIMTTRHQLVSLKLAKGPVFDQVEALAQELLHTKTCLEVVKAEHVLFTDGAMVGTLV